MYEVCMRPNWDEAPPEATHHLRHNDGDSWWIKVGDNHGYHHAKSADHLWSYDHRDFYQTYMRLGWNIVPRPKAQLNQGEHKMFTAKQLKDTYPHKQMRMYIEATVGDVAKRPAALGQLVKKFLSNCAAAGFPQEVPKDVDAAFTWHKTPEGHGLWSAVNSYFPKEVANPLPEVKKVPVAEKVREAPKPKVGWW